MDRPLIGTTRGYSLVELMVALGLATLVLYAVVSLTASMLRFSVLGATRADVGTWTVFGLHQLQRDIENATYITLPASASADDKLSGCANWASKGTSSSAGGVLDSANPAVESFYYCVANLGSPSVPSLLRYTQTVCPALDPGCGSSGYSVIAKHFYNIDDPVKSVKFFTRPANHPNVIELRYSLGISTANLAGQQGKPEGLYQATPQYMKVETAIRWNKAYLNPDD